MKLNLSIAAAGLFLCGCVVSGEAANFDELLKKLESDRYAEREEATAALIANVDTLWEPIEKASRSGEIERRTRLKSVMFEPTRRWLAGQLELARKDVDDFQTLKNAKEAKAKKEEQKLFDEESKLDDLERKAAAARDKLPADADKTAAEEALRAATAKREECIARQRMLREEMDAFQKDARFKFFRMQSIADQVAQALAECRPLGRTFPERWKPDLLPKELRASAHVSFEFVDTPLDEALREIVLLSKIEIDADAVQKDLPPITLRVQDMSAELAMHWVCRLAELQVRYDDRAQKFILGK